MNNLPAWPGCFNRRAKRTQAERLQLTGKLIQNKLKRSALLQARESSENPWAAIEDVLPCQEFINSLEETRFLSRKDNFDLLHLITGKYSTLRKYAPRMLSVVDSWSGFTRHFTHLKNSNVRPKDKKLLLTTILADGIIWG